MSLRYALLGLLEDEAASGYELTKRFEQALNRYAWHAQQNQIYQELNRLADDGLIEVVAQGPRGRKTYAITERGSAELRAWLRNTPESATVRNEFMLRLFLLFALGRDEAREQLAAYVESTERRIAELRVLVDQMDDSKRDDPLAYGTLAAQFGLHFLPAVRDWAADAMERIDRQEDEDGGHGEDDGRADSGDGDTEKGGAGTGG